MWGVTNCGVSIPNVGYAGFDQMWSMNTKCGALAVGGLGNRRASAQGRRARYMGGQHGPPDIRNLFFLLFHSVDPTKTRNPETLDPKPGTRNPEPKRRKLEPRPWTLNPKP